MIRAASILTAVTSVLVASATWACGGPPPAPVPGRAGTTVAEAGGSLSIFSANPNGYSWDRVVLPSAERTHVGNITGDLSGSIETDARVNTGISAQLGSLVELTATGASPLSDDAAVQTTVFGAALDASSKWHVLSYLASTKTVTLFAETGETFFTKVASLPADCGSVSMLDTVIESDGSLLGLCGSVALELRDGVLTTVQLPVTPLSMTLGTNGHAVAYGIGSNGSDLVVMSHDATAGWSTSSTIASAATPQIVFPRDETSVVVKQPAGYVAYTLANGSWTASSPLDATLPVTSAMAGSPARVLSGQFELTMHSTDGSPNGAWTSTDLGFLGTEPVDPGSAPKGSGFGCTIVGTGMPLALLAAMTLARIRRRQK